MARELMAVADARQRILADLPAMPSEQVALPDAHGRVLAADVAARVTQPPLAVSAMDGYAVRAADVAKVPAELKVVGEVPAGGLFEGTVAPGQAVRIFTGAPVPDGADAIVLQEDTARDGDAVTANEGDAAGVSERLLAAADAASAPKYVSLIGQAHSGTSEVAAALAAQHGATVVSGADADLAGAFAGGNGWFVLDGVFENSDQAAAATAAFGAPRAGFYLKASKETLTDRASTANSLLEEPAEFDAEAYGADCEGKEPLLAGVVDSAAAAGFEYTELNGDADAASHVAACGAAFVNNVHLLVCPAGKGLSGNVAAELSSVVSDALLCDCSALLADADNLLAAGDSKHRNEVAELARQAAVSASAPDVEKKNPKPPINFTRLDETRPLHSYPTL